MGWVRVLAGTRLGLLGSRYWLAIRVGTLLVAVGLTVEFVHAFVCFELIQ